jgi:hypothetical protein
VGAGDDGVADADGAAATAPGQMIHGFGGDGTDDREPFRRNGFW